MPSVAGVARGPGGAEAGVVCCVLAVFGKGNNLRPYGPVAVDNALVTCVAVRTVVGSIDMTGEGEEKYRLSKMAREMALLRVQLSIVSHLWRYRPLGNECAKSLL